MTESSVYSTREMQSARHTSDRGFADVQPALSKRKTIINQHKVKLDRELLMLPQKELTVSKFQASETKMGEVSLKLMHKYSIIDSLTIMENSLTDRMFEILCRGISENISLRAIEIHNCRLSKNQFTLLFDAILKR